MKEVREIQKLEKACEENYRKGEERGKKNDSEEDKGTGEAKL